MELDVMPCEKPTIFGSPRGTRLPGQVSMLGICPFSQLLERRCCARGRLKSFPKATATSCQTYSTYTANPRKLEHGFRMISARIPYTLPQGHEDNNVPTFFLLLYPSLESHDDPFSSRPLQDLHV